MTENIGKKDELPRNCGMVVVCTIMRHDASDMRIDAPGFGYGTKIGA